MLEKLALKDKDWRKMAYHICKCRTTADDLVQDMYIYFANYNKEVNDFYVYFAIKQIHIRKIQREKIKTVDIPDNYNFKISRSKKGSLFIFFKTISFSWSL